MADYSFAPSGGPRGYLGAYNFGIDTEKTLMDMGQKKESHDLQMLQDRLKYDQARKQEELLGDLSRDSARRDLQDKDLMRDTVMETTKAKKDTEVAQAEILQRTIQMDKAAKKMDAMEAAEAYLRSRGGENGEMMPAPSDLDGSHQQLLSILNKGGWGEDEINQHLSKGPQALTQWVQEGARAAKVDAPKLAESRKRIHELMLAQARKTEPNEKLYSPMTTLGKYIEMETWGPKEKQAVRGLLPLAATNLRNDVFYEIAQMQNLSDKDKFKLANETYQSRLQSVFGPIYERLGEKPPSEAPTTTGKPEPTANTGPVKPDPKAKKGSKNNPIPIAKPSDLPKTPDGNWYVAPSGNLYDRTGGK